jgi:adenosyl cobinamide kinase/adenosyl cobinamide phosphate guanylyltransferase
MHHGSRPPVWRNFYKIKIDTFMEELERIILIVLFTCLTMILTKIDTTQKLGVLYSQKCC